MRAARLLVSCVVTALAGCSGPDERRPIDAAPRPDAVTVDASASDAPPGLACVDGGAAAVTVDLGGDAAPLQFTTAWWNRGNTSKACFKIDVVLSTGTTVADPYLSDPQVLELVFPFEPALGANQVQLHLHQPDQFLGGTATVTALDDVEVVGSVTATAGAVMVTGAFTARRCLGIFDPCI